MNIKKILPLCTLLFFLPVNAQTPQSFVISIADEGKVVSWYKKYITKAYADLGFRIVYKPMPTGRGQIEAQKGYLDALAIRMSAIESSFPDFVRVPVLLGQWNLMLYCQKHVQCDPSILDDHQHVVGIVVGANITNEYMKDKLASIYEVKTGIELAEIFNKQRLDYILSISSPDKGNYASINVNKSSSVSLMSIEAYHYLHKRHHQLLPELKSSLANAIFEIGPIPDGYLKNAAIP